VFFEFFTGKTDNFLLKYEHSIYKRSYIEVSYTINFFRKCIVYTLKPIYSYLKEKQV